MPSILGDIARAIELAAPGWDIQIGFSTTADDWVEENRATNNTILVSFDSDEPIGVYEDGTPKGYRTFGSIYMRARASIDQFEDEIRPTYKAMRRAISGLVCEEDGVKFVVTVGPGRAAVGNGIAVPSLQWSAE